MQVAFVEANGTIVGGENESDKMIATTMKMTQ